MASRIYIVEDDPIVREMVSDYISIVSDFEVCGLAATGEEALEALADVEAELVLVDASLPEMSGIDLVAQVIERRPGLRCLMYSGYGDATFVERALTAGARGYVMKGNPDELVEAIRRVLAGEEEVYLSELLLCDLQPGRSDGSLRRESP